MVNLNAVEAARWRSDRRLSSRSLQAVFVIVFVASTNATRFFSLLRLRSLFLARRGPPLRLRALRSLRHAHSSGRLLFACLRISVGIESRKIQ
jgi:hypothetical protein